MASAERIFHLLEMENALPFPANPVTPLPSQVGLSFETSLSAMTRSIRYP